MKVAILGESSADEAAFTLLVEAILGSPVARSDLKLRGRGWPQVRQSLPAVIKHLHFNSDAEALVVIVDSNGSSEENIHSTNHDPPAAHEANCRFCSLHALIQGVLHSLPPRQFHAPLRFALGLAVPAVEAWLLSGSKPGMTEANWRTARQERPPREPYTRPQLKELAYGTTKPALPLETQRMAALMTEIAKEIPRLQTAFPGGFGPLKLAIDSWKTATP